MSQRTREQPQNKLTDSLLVKCDAKTYFQDVLSDITGLMDAISNSFDAFELDNPSIRISALAITRAKALNGYQWKGIVEITVSASRRSEARWTLKQRNGPEVFERTGDYSRWSPWSGNATRTVFKSYAIAKVKGEWRYLRSFYFDREDHIGDLDLASYSTRRLSCSEIPPE